MDAESFFSSIIQVAIGVAGFAEFIKRPQAELQIDASLDGDLY